MVSVAAPASDAAAHRRPGTGVPILIYHVIARAPPAAPFPGLYVPLAEFAAQMDALAAAGYHAVTLDQVRAAWLGTGRLPSRPIVISFDNGYRTQFTRALPVLRRLGWVGDENLQLSGLPAVQGGLTTSQIRALVSAHWELDTQGYSHLDLVGMDRAQLRYQIAAARMLIRRRFHVRADWFCYPSGDYNTTVIAEVKAARFVGATTVVPGWARATEDPYRLPRLRVLAGTSPQRLLVMITGARDDPVPPLAYPARS
jgi:peptidoglycan/xylan/chitin deacetylase (PgdA/CDA1 family)